MKKEFQPESYRLSLSTWHFILAGICLLLLLFACSKPNDLPANDPGKIEFKISGQQKTYMQVTASTATVSGSKLYSFVGTKEPTTDNLFTVSIMTDNLQPGTYSLASGMVHWREGSNGANNMASGFTVTITSNDNGKVNGSFAGIVQTYSGANASIAEGIIHNIQIQ